MATFKGQIKLHVKEFSSFKTYYTTPVFFLDFFFTLNVPQTFFISNLTIEPSHRSSLCCKCFASNPDVCLSESLNVSSVFRVTLTLVAAEHLQIIGSAAEDITTRH